MRHQPIVSSSFLVFIFTVLAANALSQQPPVPPVDRFADPLKSPERVAFKDGKFEIRPGEVIVLTGSANGVFEQQQGYLETLLTAGAKDAKPIFRNMCWEGDTVFEQWRAMNFGKWSEQFDAVGASTIVLWFGQLEVLDDTKTVDDFRAAFCPNSPTAPPATSSTASAAMWGLICRASANRSRPS